MKASVTYRSEVEHSVGIEESSVGTGTLSAIMNNPALAGVSATGDTDVTTPQSVNLDFQTGVMANTVAFA